MKKSFAMACASHSPLMMDERYASADVCRQVKRHFGTLARFIDDFEPDIVIQFSPDHFHGFHYDLMPSFCVGTAARSVGDWGTADGTLDVDEEYALAVLEAIRDSDVDAAVSFDMVVDHGFVQIWEVMFGRFDNRRMVPIFINAVGHPLPRYRRVRLLGEAIGRFVATSQRRVLFVASGGLSHDPVVPRMRGASAEVRERLLGRAAFGAEQQAARERVVHAAAALAVLGEGPSKPLNPEWDQMFLRLLESREWAAIDAFTPAGVERDAGAGGNEVLAWVAAAAALSAARGGYEIQQQDYLAIPGWIAGMALVSAH